MKKTIMTAAAAFLSFTTNVGASDCDPIKYITGPMMAANILEEFIGDDTFASAYGIIAPLNIESWSEFKGNFQQAAQDNRVGVYETPRTCIYEATLGENERLFQIIVKKR